MRLELDGVLYDVPAREIALEVYARVHPWLTGANDWFGVRPALKLFLRPFEGKLVKAIRLYVPQWPDREKGQEILPYLAQGLLLASIMDIEGRKETVVARSVERILDDGTVLRVVEAAPLDASAPLAEAIERHAPSGGGGAGAAPALAAGGGASSNVLAEA